MNDPNAVETNQPSDPVHDRSRPFAVVCLGLACLLTLWFAQWLLSGGSILASQTQQSATPSVPQHAQAREMPPMLTIFEGAMPGQPMQANPQHLPDPPHDKPPVRFQRINGKTLEQVAVFKTDEPLSPSTGVLARWHSQLESAGWRGPVQAVTRRRSDPATSLRYDRGHGEYLWIQYRPAQDSYHDLLLAYIGPAVQSQSEHHMQSQNAKSLNNKPHGDR